MRELIELALMQTSVIAHPEKALVKLGSSGAERCSNIKRSATSIQHTHPAIATVNAGNPARKHTHIAPKRRTRSP